MRVAVLGATGHVGKSVVAQASNAGEHAVTAVARNREKLESFLDELPSGAHVSRASFEDFADGCYDVVVNCLGVGDPARLTEVGAEIFALTEQFDAIAGDYLAAHPDALCVNFSSGAAYCGAFERAATEETEAVVDINQLSSADYYGVAKLASEARHRANAGLAIVDLRLFGFFSRHIDRGARYLMNDVLAAVETQTELVVGPEETVRDYVAPADLYALLSAVMEAGPHNEVYDVYSARPVSKAEILDAFAGRYGLAYRVDEGRAGVAATGSKPNYYSENRRAQTIGYQPSRTSLETLLEEADALVGRHGGAGS